MEFEKEVHEGSITAQIVETVLRETRKKKAKKIVEVKLSIGALSFLNPVQVRFWYDLLTKETILEDSKLLIEEKRGTVRCRDCDYEGDFKFVNDSAFHLPMPTLQCPQCDGIVEILSGKDCVVKSIKILA